MTERQEVIDEVLAEMDPGDCLTICQGPPVCELLGDEAEAAQAAGCVWCERVWCNDDGSFTTKGLSRC